MVTMALVTMALDTLCEPQTHTEPVSHNNRPRRLEQRPLPGAE